jgi:predicted SAM-dependent methyltransferase
METKLNLACGPDYREGYINIDNQSMFPDSRVDKTADIFTLDWELNSVDEIYVSHFVMYVRPEKIMGLLRKWHSWLKENGSLIIEAQDIKKMAQILINETNPSLIDSHALTNFYGNERTCPHQWGYYPESMGKALYKSGFSSCEYLNGDKKPERDFKIIAIK